MVAETRLSVDQTVLPLFVRSGRNVRREIESMPGVFQLSADELLREASQAHDLGVPAVLLFGIPDRKDEKASEAYARNGIVQQAVRAVKRAAPDLLVVGGPTHVRGLSSGIHDVFKGLEGWPELAAAFDTRLHGPACFTGRVVCRCASARYVSALHR